MHGINYYDQPLYWVTFTHSYDLQTGRYWAFRPVGENRVWDYNVTFSMQDFSPDALRRAGIR